ncbi:MAG: GNAT family N-acetyltransferase [Anaerolineae bacterium]|nr:GNAT family N-acetyltransferase [Anaerolineae bacterium]
MTTLSLWRFCPDPADIGEALGYADPEHADRRWREVEVPVDFETCYPGLDAYEGTGWFRHRVNVSEERRGRRATLRFEGVNSRARVWVNGAEVGMVDAPYLPSAFDIHSRLRFGRPNLIAVRVDNKRQQGNVPGMQWGWRNFGGILREVTLEFGDLCALHTVKMVATPEEVGGHLTVEVRVLNQREEAVDGLLVTTVAERDGVVLATLPETPVAVAAGGEAAVSLAGVVPGAQSWSPEIPTLYVVRVALRRGGEDIDVRTLRVGFRTIEVGDGTLLLNGEPIFLTGFNRHEDSPSRNMCPDTKLARRDFVAMKEAGANFVRLCHYPHHPDELDLCDELGLLVMDEIPLYWWNGLAEGDAAAAAKLAAAERQLSRLVERDFNHPSVVFWSVSNETEEHRPEVVSGNRTLVRMARDLDPTRLAVHVSDHWQEHPRFEDDDVICVNAYPSVGAIVHSGKTDYDLSTSSSFWRSGLAQLHGHFPDKPILIAEFGYVSLHDVVDGAYGGDLHADVIEHEFAGMNAPYVCGATVWCWADHAWPPATFAFSNYLSISPYGVLTRDRRRKPAYWAARRIFRAKQGVVEPAATAAAASPRPPGPEGWPVIMVRPHLEDIPVVALPEGFTLRALRRDEGGLWTDIWRDAEPFARIDADLFASQFGDDLPALERRGLIVENAKGVGVATITSWYNRTHKGEDYGQIHWVATRESYWGRGIGKAMLSQALRQMAQWHDKAFLGTQTNRLPAIKLYLSFGFVPDLDEEGAREAWREVKAALDHAVLNSMDI